MTTPILEIQEISANQLDQYLTANGAFRALEAATQNFTDLDFSAEDISIEGEVFQRHFLLRASGNTVARVLELPGVIRFFAVLNQGSEALTIRQGVTDILLSAGASAFYFTDGTVNGLVSIG